MSDQGLYKEFGRAVALRRDKLEMTQAELASRIGMSRASIANIESGRQTVPLHYVYALARALEMHLIDLLPAPPQRPIVSERLQVPLKGDEVSAAGMTQLSDLIASAMATARSGS